jgi:CO/xanthine dehydrogenase Mo-binding subunit
MPVRSARVASVVARIVPPTQKKPITFNNVVVAWNASRESARAVGDAAGIIDGAEKVTGALGYTADMAIPGLLHTKLVLSERPHARIVALDLAAAGAMPGVAGIFWHGNTPHGRYNSSIWFEGQEALEDEEMFPEVVRHVGDRVAAVVAETPEIAARAARLIRVTYEDRLAMLDPLAAKAHRGPTTDAGGTPTFLNPIEDKHFAMGDVNAAMARADLVVETRVVTPKTHHAAIEPHVAVAMPEGDGRIRIYSPCQSIFAVQVVVAKALGMTAADFRVIKPPIGGSFGGKAEPILDPLCAFFAKVLQRPVTIALSRQETCLATRMRSRVHGTMRTALTRDGRILARDTETLADVGAYSTGGNYLPGSMLQRLVRLYDVPNERYDGQAVYTNTPPTGAFRGYGSPQIHTLAEINMDQAATALRLDPLELRLRNILGPHAIEPYQGLDVGNAGIRECLEQGAVRFGWRDRRASARHEGRKRSGVGLACAAHVNGCFPGSDEQSTVTMRMAADGRVEIVAALHDLGCGANTTLTQIAAEELSLDPHRFVIVPSDTDHARYDIGTRASRMTYILGEAIRRAAVALRNEVLREASRLMNCAADDLSLVDGGLRHGYGAGARLTFSDMASQLAGTGSDLPQATSTYAATANPSSYAAHFAAVEVDVYTGRVKVTDYLAAHDVGRAINPMLVEGQIHGGIQNGIGYGLFEDVVIDPATGVMKADRFSRYHIVNAPEMPPVDILLVEKGEPTGPFGAKAVGEIATIPVAAAVVNAVNHALGTSLTDLPLTPEKIVAALWP